MLTVNYRSPLEVVEMASVLKYENRLVANAAANTTVLRGSGILDGQDIPVRFHHIAGEERIDQHQSYANEAEYRLVEDYYRRCLNHGLTAEQIGIITPYNNQATMIQQLLADQEGLVVDTVETFQGDERDVIIISTVRTKGIGFLRDQRRFNTAMTRPKQMLIVVGNANLLARNNYLRAFLKEILRLDVQHGIIDEVEAMPATHWVDFQ